MLDPAQNEVIVPILLKLSKNNEQGRDMVTMQLVINELEDVIAESFKECKTFDNVKSVWSRRMQSAATLSKVTMSQDKCSWKRLQTRFDRWMSKQPESTATSASGNASTSTAASRSTSSSNVASPTSSFDTPATNADKLIFMERFDSLDKSRFWVLDATKMQAEVVQNGIALSVEEKVHDFVVDFTFIQLAFSFILDLSDETWLDVFTRAEIEELNGHRRAMLTDLEEEHREIIQLLANMTSPFEVYIWPPLCLESCFMLAPTYRSKLAKPTFPFSTASDRFQNQFAICRSPRWMYVQLKLAVAVQMTTRLLWTRES